MRWPRPAEGRPSIIGPHAWTCCGPPPQFRVDTAELTLFMVELAHERELMACVTGRSRHNYFFGGESGNAFATGPTWRVPTKVWAVLRSASPLYYRVVVVDPTSGTSRPSVDDDHLDLLPAITVERVHRCRDCGPG